MPSLKELRAELKKSMKPIGKMSRDEVVLMLEKHKPDNVVIPKTKMVAEHKDPDVLEKPTPKKLKKEAEKQEKELKVMKVKVPMVKYDSSDEETAKPVKTVAAKTVKKVLSSKPPTEVVDKRKQWAIYRKEGLSSADAWKKIKGEV